MVYLLDGFFERLKIFPYMTPTRDIDKFTERYRRRNKKLDILRVSLTSKKDGAEFLEINAIGVLGNCYGNFLYEGDEAGEFLNYPEMSEQTKEARKISLKLQRLKPGKMELIVDPTQLGEKQERIFKKKLGVKLTEEIN